MARQYERFPQDKVEFDVAGPGGRLKFPVKNGQDMSFNLMFVFMLLAEMAENHGIEDGEQRVKDAVESAYEELGWKEE